MYKVPSNGLQLRDLDISNQLNENLLQDGYTKKKMIFKVKSLYYLNFVIMVLLVLQTIYGLIGHVYVW